MKLNKNLISLSLITLLFTVGYILLVRKSGDDTVPKKIKTSGALTALDLWSNSRAYPNEVIPDAGHYSAYEYVKQNLSKENDNRTHEWEQLGPHNVGGRTIALAFNPLNGNTVYAGSASGGLWRSYSGGVGTSAWERITTGYPVLGVGAIDIAPNDSNTIYIGTGEVYGYQNSIGGITVRETRGSYGIGILKSTNNGASWIKSLDWSYSQKRGVQVIRINPKNPSVVYAGTTEGTYITRDAGTTWTQINNTIMVTDLVINPIDTNIVFIACGNLGSTGNGIYRSTNSGGSFTKLTNGLPISYAGKAIFSMYKTSPNVLFASIGNGFQTGAGTWLVKTVDNGDTWTTVSTLDYSTYQGWFAHFVGVNPVDSSKVLTAGVDIFKSTNGGYDLQQKSLWYAWFFGRTPIGGPEGPPDYSHADHHAIAYHPSNPNITYFGNDGGVFRTTDGGETFEGCNGGYQTSQFYNGFSSAGDDSLFSIGGMQDNSTAIWDGQLAWIRVLGGDGSWTAVNYRNKDTVYGSSQYLNVARSLDGGNNFNNIPIPGNGVEGFIAPFITGRVNPQIMYAGSSLVFRSSNAGTSWAITNGGSPLNTNNPLLCLNSSPLNDNIVYATTSPVTSTAKFFLSSNGGNTWNNYSAGLPDRYLVDIMADPVEAGTVYVTASGYGTGHVFKSTNYGSGWQDITNNLPDVPTSSIVIDPSNNDFIYVGNDIGVFLTTNGGASWEQFVTGMPEAAIVMDLSISIRNRMIRAVTHGNGVYQREMADATVGITNNAEIVSYALHQNYPNPFNPKTKISFDIVKPGNVLLRVYDINGREAAVLVNRHLPSGRHIYEFDASRFSSGVYFYEIISENFTAVKKMLLIK